MLHLDASAWNKSQQITLRPFVASVEKERRICNDDRETSTIYKNQYKQCTPIFSINLIYEIDAIRQLKETKTRRRGRNRKRTKRSKAVRKKCKEKWTSVKISDRTDIKYHNIITCYTVIERSMLHLNLCMISLSSFVSIWTKLLGKDLRAQKNA